MDRAAKEGLQARAELVAKVDGAFRVPRGVPTGPRVPPVQTEASVWMDPTGDPARGLRWSQCQLIRFSGIRALGCCLSITKEGGNRPPYSGAPLLVFPLLGRRAGYPSAPQCRQRWSVTWISFEQMPQTGEFGSAQRTPCASGIS